MWLYTALVQVVLELDANIRMLLLVSRKLMYLSRFLMRKIEGFQIGGIGGL